jgi:hypothetical protein
MTTNLGLVARLVVRWLTQQFVNQLREFGYPEGFREEPGGVRVE